MSMQAAFRAIVQRFVGLALVLSFLSGWLIMGGGPLSQPVHAQGQAASGGVGGCPFFPTDNIWNYDISNVPVNSNSSNYINSIGPSIGLHPDFGAGKYGGGPIGIPFVVVPGSQKFVPVHFKIKNESDPGPYPIPPNAPIEGGPHSTGDRHVLVVDSGTCALYEMYHSYPHKHGSSWSAYSGARWDLNSNHLRPAGWTSADAAGLPILPGLVTYDEVASGVINHALRFTVSSSQAAYLWPARHYASSSHDPNLPPMGLRLRLKANVDISHFSATNQVILTALKQYGMFVADNGSSWYISGAPDKRWHNSDLHLLDQIVGSDFEAVDESALQSGPNSGKVKLPTTSISTHALPMLSLPAPALPTLAALREHAFAS